MPPYQRAIYGRSAQIVRRLPIVSAIDQVYQRAAQIYSAPANPDLTVPFFLSAVLGRISSPSEIPDAISDLRERTKEIRVQKSELEQALASGKPNEIKKLEKVLSGAYRKSGYELAAKATGAGLLSILPLISTSIPAAIVPAIFFLAAVAIVNKDDWDRLSTSLLQPAWLCLSDMGKVAEEVIDAYPRISDLWQLDGSAEDRFRHGVSRLGRLA